jgi:hypothetical protein
MKFVICAGALMLAIGALMARNANDEGWISMFDGKTLDGWKANGHPESWSAKNGEIVGDGEASHLFWMVKECVNCEFKADVKINHGGNSGMYIRTAFGPGFPHGYEAQVDNTHRDPVRTGSLYNFAPFYKQLIPDDTWWNQRVIAQGNHIVIYVNDTKTADYTDKKDTYAHGYLALQQHNKGGIVEYKNLYMKPLP